MDILKIRSFEGHEAPVYSLGKYGGGSFISGGGDRLVCNWNLEGEPFPTGIIQTQSTIYSILDIPQNKILLIGVSGGGMHVVDLVTKKEVHFLLLHTNGLFDIAYSKTHNRIITAGGDGKVAFWSGDDYSLVHAFQLCHEKVRVLELNIEETKLAIGCGDGTIRIFDMKTSRQEKIFSAHNGSVHSLAFHPVNEFLISGGRDAHLNVWDLQSHECQVSIPAHNYAIYSIRFSPDSSLFASCSRDRNIKIWDGITFSVLARIDKEKYQGHTHSVNKLLWMEEMLISAGDDRKIYGWKINRNKTG